MLEPRRSPHTLVVKLNTYHPDRWQVERRRIGTVFTRPSCIQAREQCESDDQRQRFIGSQNFHEVRIVLLAVDWPGVVVLAAGSEKQVFMVEGYFEEWGDGCLEGLEQTLFGKVTGCDSENLGGFELLVEERRKDFPQIFCERLRFFLQLELDSGVVLRERVASVLNRRGVCGLVDSRLCMKLVACRLKLAGTKHTSLRQVKNV